MANGAGAARQSAEQDDLAELLTKLAAAVADEASHNVRFRSVARRALWQQPMARCRSIVRQVLALQNRR